MTVAALPAPSRRATRADACSHVWEENWTWTGPGGTITWRRALRVGIVPGERISRDPIAEDGGINLYGYCGGNPILYRDPDGRLVIVAPVLAGAGIVLGGAAIYCILNPQACGLTPLPAPSIPALSIPSPMDYFIDTQLLLLRVCMAEAAEEIPCKLLEQIEDRSYFGGGGGSPAYTCIYECGGKKYLMFSMTDPCKKERNYNKLNMSPAPDDY
jgi:hypothetical protein